MHGRNKNALDLPTGRSRASLKSAVGADVNCDQAINDSARRRHLVFPGAYVVVYVNRQGFLTPGSNALASRPSQSRKISDHFMEAAQSPVTVAGTVRVFHPLPLYSSRNTCDGQPVLRVDAIYLCSKDHSVLREPPTLSRILETHKRS